MASPLVAFRILGPLDVQIDGRQADLGPRQALVLAALLLHLPRPVPVGRLMECVWDRPTESAASNLRTHVTALRRVIGKHRVVSLKGFSGYAMNVDDGELDSRVFARFLAHGTQALGEHDWAAAVALLAKALRQWRGQPLEGLPLPATLRMECALLDEQRAVAADGYIEARLMLGDLAGLPEFIRPLLAEQPYREDRWARYMLSLYRCGRVAEALAAYARVRAVLSDGVGLDPSRRLRRLHERMLACDPVLDMAPEVLATDAASTS